MLKYKAEIYGNPTITTLEVDKESKTSVSRTVTDAFGHSIILREPKSTPHTLIADTFKEAQDWLLDYAATRVASAKMQLETANKVAAAIKAIQEQ